MKAMKKLTKTLLINWLYFEKELISFDDINFLTGKNGSGKTTFIDALQIVLLGELAEETSTSGEGKLGTHATRIFARGHG
jgi:DNA repair exonuclease SbcCD ATPase subunit